MARSPLTFKQRDITAALKAVADAGYEIARVRVSRAGDIIVEIGKPHESIAAETEKNEWDK